MLKSTLPNLAQRRKKKNTKTKTISNKGESSEHKHDLDDGDNNDNNDKDKKEEEEDDDEDEDELEVKFEDKACTSGDDFKRPTELGVDSAARQTRANKDKNLKIKADIARMQADYDKYYGKYASLVSTE